MSKSSKENPGSNLDSLSISDFTKELSLKSPAPGGGSTAALAGALACSLIGMVARISVKRLQTTTYANKAKLEKLITASDRARKQFLSLINDDTVAFNDILNSYKLPKNNDNEKKKRTLAIQRATKHAAEVPLTTAKLGIKTMSWVRELVGLGPEQTITDLGVAGLMAHSAIFGAVWNVKINLSSIKDKDFVSKKLEEIDWILKSISKDWREIQESIESKI